MSDAVIHVSDDNFEAEVLKSDIPVLVDFWAIWCGPCKAIAPLVEKLADTHAGKLKIAKVDVDKSPQVPARYFIRSIPTLILFKDGEVLDQLVGAVSQQRLDEFVAKAL